MTQIREGGFQQIYTIFKQVLEFAYCKSCSNVSKVYQTRGLGSLINVPNGRLLFIFKFLDSFPDEEWSVQDTLSTSKVKFSVTDPALFNKRF